ncbi:Calx-beta domain-containing protein [Diaminobutyricibacter sp. McL0608]|uniref:Calx-beta domain-containing protein n=1 Tax=Leifsonia sp. McL0608 TaxID=3143537 RepID=UPI0031F2ECB7
MKRSPGRGFRAVAAVVPGAVFALVALGPAVAAPDPITVAPFVDCVSSAPGATPDAFTVVFGFRNSSASAVAFAPGSAQNTFTLGGDRGQPATFDPGVHHAVFATTFSGGPRDLTWTLGTTTIGIDATTPSCGTATTVALSAPPTAAAGDPFDVTASVGRMLLASPTTGSVEFSVDSAVAAVAPVDGQGVARASLDAPEAGSHTITARYVPQTATPQLLGSAAAVALSVTPADAISIASSGLSADGHSARFIVSRTVSDTTAHVDYVTADGSAQAGRDYASSRGTVRFAVGQRSATVAIPLLDRPFGSPAASFFVLLQRASGGVEVAGATAVLPRVAAVTAPTAGHDAAGAGLAPVPHVPSASSVAAPSTGTHPGAGSADLALLFGGLLLTVGAAFGVVGMMRLRSSEG